MTRPAFLTSASLVFLVSACNKPTSPPERDVNIAESKWLNDAAIQNAIIAQHTLYPYHFITYSASLNELGEHDFGVLIEHYKDHPGPLNVRRGDASLELQEARVRFVTDKLLKAGIDLGPIEDGAPGGEGMLSDHVLTVLERSYEAGNKGASGDMSTGARSAAVANRGGSIK